MRGRGVYICGHGRGGESETDKDTMKPSGKNKLSKEYQIWEFLIFILIVGISFIGYNRVNHSNQHQDIRQALNDAFKMKGGCANPENGGWPCVNIAIKNLRAVENQEEIANYNAGLEISSVPVKSMAKFQICGEITVSEEIGLPGNNDFQLLPVFTQCSDRSGQYSNFYGDLSQKYILSDFLKQLNNLDCSSLSSEMSDNDKALYC